MVRGFVFALLTASVAVSVAERASADFGFVESPAALHATLPWSDAPDSLQVQLYSVLKTSFDRPSTTSDAQLSVEVGPRPIGIIANNSRIVCEANRDSEGAEASSRAYRCSFDLDAIETGWSSDRNGLAHNLFNAFQTFLFAEPGRESGHGAEPFAGITVHQHPEGTVIRMTDAWSGSTIACQRRSPIQGPVETRCRIQLVP